MNEKLEFWFYIIDRLNEPAPSILEVLEELRQFLGFAYGFVYHSDYASICCLEDYCTVIDNHWPRRIDLPACIGPELLEDLKKQKIVAFRADTPKTKLMERLADIFKVSSMLLLPITNRRETLLGFIGIADRRGVARLADDDMVFSYSILNTLAAYVKNRLYQAQIDSTQKALESIIDNMGIDIYVNDFNTHEILYVNRSMAEPYGGADNMLGKICWQVLYDNKHERCDYCPSKKIIDENGCPARVYSWDYRRPFDGKWFRVLSAAFQWVDGRLAHLVSSIDITENKKNEDIIRWMAENDSLTRLPNRRKLTGDCDDLVAAKNAQKEGAFIIFFDLDGFKAINDTLGHQTGDELLVQIGEMLRRHPLIRNCCYRFGGDEFVILCDGEAPSAIAEVLDYLRESFANPFQLKNGTAGCKASVGVSCCPGDDDKTSGLIRKADIAMYHAKKEGGGRVFFYNQGCPIPAQEYMSRINRYKQLTEQGRFAQ